MLASISSRWTDTKIRVHDPHSSHPCHCPSKVSFSILLVYRVGDWLFFFSAASLCKRSTISSCSSSNISTVGITNKRLTGRSSSGASVGCALGLFMCFMRSDRAYESASGRKTVAGSKGGKPGGLRLSCGRRRRSTYDYRVRRPKH